jgi:polysaccharide export outer membrane protein
VPGYLVDKNGEIELPLVGRIKVGGMTTTEARNAIGGKASQFYKNPVVNVRFVNFRITVLGEVGSPGQYTVPAEKATIYDALGMAGDLTVGGKRNDILLMREEGGEKKFVRLDLNSKDLFQSPYFYLRQNDVLYVGPTKNRAVSADASTARTLGFVTIGLSIVTLVVTFLRF